MAFNIMVVDDDDMNLTLLSKILELEGYSVTRAHNGIEAIQSVVHKMPDLALLDVMMPDMNGYDLCRKLRQPPIGADIPIVLLTAMNTDGEQKMAVEAGANEIWSKPFDIEKLRKKTGELLKKH